MAVFTEVSFDEAGELMRALPLGELQSIRECAGGIENTNYFIETSGGSYVLTVFERLNFEQLPFYLHLMKHLAERGIPVPAPAAARNGDILLRLKGKPAAVVDRLHGASVLAPGAAHCTQVGHLLARMHLAGVDYAGRQPSLRGLDWWNSTAPLVLPHISADQRILLLGELAYQNHVAASPAFSSLPAGPIHGDLFRDNVMFEGDRLTGLFDFYFAGCDHFLFDIAVCLNDWCVDLDSGREDVVRGSALIAGYQAVRCLTSQERSLLPALLRAAALRFWISRLWDFHLPREAAVLTAHDPFHFEQVLRNRVAHPGRLPA